MKMGTQSHGALVQVMFRISKKGVMASGSFHGSFSGVESPNSPITLNKQRCHVD